MGQRGLAVRSARVRESAGVQQVKRLQPSFQLNVGAMYLSPLLAVGQLDAGNQHGSGERGRKKALIEGNNVANFRRHATAIFSFRPKQGVPRLMRWLCAAKLTSDYRC